MTDSVDHQAWTVLVEHQQHSSGECACGYFALGESHAAHVVKQLRDLGLLRDEVTDGT